MLHYRVGMTPRSFGIALASAIIIAPTTANAVRCEAIANICLGMSESEAVLKLPSPPKVTLLKEGTFGSKQFRSINTIFQTCRGRVTHVSQSKPGSFNDAVLLLKHEISSRGIARLSVKNDDLDPPRTSAVFAT